MTVYDKWDNLDPERALAKTEAALASAGANVDGVTFFDDFMGSTAAYDTSGNVDNPWTASVTGKSVLVKKTNNVKNGGWLELSTSSQNEPQTAELGMTNVSLFNSDYGVIGDCRFAVRSMAGNNQGSIIFGHDFMQFRIDPDYSLKVGQSHEDSGIVLDQNRAYIVKCDASDLENVKFYLDGVQLFPLGTFPGVSSNNMQPRMRMEKSGGTEAASMFVDWIRVVQATRPDFNV